MKITVGIPTIAGRQDSLRHCLQTCVTQDYTDLEILVSDNSAGDALDTVQAFTDTRIRYIRPASYLPMSRHWDFMLQHMTGDLVTIIGDDDGLMPDALSVVRRIITQYGMRPLQHTIAQYHWPDANNHKSRNTFWFHQTPGTDVAIIRSDEYLRRLCRCAVGYIDGPMVYHNFVPRPLLQDLQRDGFVFHRSSPDVYSAITVALHSPDFISTGKVLTVAGEGAKSNGAQCRDGGSEGQRFLRESRVVEEKTHFAAHTVSLATLDSIFEASDRYGRFDVRGITAIPEFYASALIECLTIRNPRLMFARTRATVRDALRLGIAPSVLSAAVCRLTHRLSGSLRSLTLKNKVYWRQPRQVEANARDVQTAAVFIARYLRDSLSVAADLPH